MTKSQKSKYIKSSLLLLSTLLFPIQIFSIFLYFIPALYISFVAPYLIWKIWFGKYKQKTQIYSFFWKIPIIIFLAFTMFYTDVLSMFIIFATEISLIGKIIIFVFLLLLLRCITYAMMIFIWQPDILKSHKIWAYAGVIIYCIANSYFIFSSPNAQDTDDYNFSFYECISSK